MVPMKICTKCKKNKSLKKFSKHAGRPDGLQGWCKECVNMDNASRYAQGEAFSYLYLGGKCSFKGCTCTDWDMLVIHHLDELLKIIDVSKLFAQPHEKLMAELKKCVLLCGNHHLKTHALQKRKANEAQYQKVIPLTPKHRGVKTPADRRRPHSVERACQL